MVIYEIECEDTNTRQLVSADNHTDMAAVLAEKGWTLVINDQEIPVYAMHDASGNEWTAMPAVVPPARHMLHASKVNSNGGDGNG